MRAQTKYEANPQIECKKKNRNSNRVSRPEEGAFTPCDDSRARQEEGLSFLIRTQPMKSHELFNPPNFRFLPIKAFFPSVGLRGVDLMQLAMVADLK